MIVALLLLALSDLALALLTVISPSQDHDHLSSNRSDCNDIYLLQNREGFNFQEVFIFRL